LLQTPIRDSILWVGWIKFILAQTGFLNYKFPFDEASKRFNDIHLASFLCFLGTFAGYWPSGVERARFSFRTASHGLTSDEAFGLYYAQVHFRYFTPSDTLNKAIGSDGLRCHRQQGQIESLDLGKNPTRFEERRISIFSILSSSIEAPRYKWTRTPSVYRVVILADAYENFTSDLRGLISESELKYYPGFGGVFAFQGAIILAMSIWETEWNNVFDKIDDSLRVELDQTMDSKLIAKWMFDLDFERSRLYFTILQVLRIFGECIRTVSPDIRALDSLFLRHSALDSNWNFITKQQKNAEERLLRRLLDKTEEVKSLRDGVQDYNPLLFAFS
jgi:hypothetical protein